MSHTYNWIVGKEYAVQDIINSRKAILRGFIINQIPVNWKNKSSYSNHLDKTVYLVLELVDSSYARFVTALPKTYNYFNDEQCFSRLSLKSVDYSDSIDGLILKVKQNWVFTPKLCYNATYKEGFDPARDLN